MADRILIEVINGDKYLTVKSLAEKYDVSVDTVRRIKKEIKGQIESRYKRQAIIEGPNLVRISAKVFEDYFSVRNEIKKGNKVEPFGE